MMRLQLAPLVATVTEHQGSNVDAFSDFLSTMAPEISAYADKITVVNKQTTIAWPQVKKHR